MNRIIATAIIAFACSIVNPWQLAATNKKDTEAIQDLIDLLIHDGGQAEIYKGPISEAFDLPDPAPTRNIDAVPKWGAEGGEEEVTDNLLHSVSVLVEKSPDGVLVPKKLLFQSRLESGRDSQTYIFLTGLDGMAEKIQVSHGKLGEDGESIQGSAVNSIAFLDTNSADAKSRLQHELDLWLVGKYFKKKFRKKHLEDLAYYRNKRYPPTEKKKSSAKRSRTSTK